MKGEKGQTEVNTITHIYDVVHCYSHVMGSLQHTANFCRDGAISNQQQKGGGDASSTTTAACSEQWNLSKADYDSLLERIAVLEKESSQLETVCVLCTVHCH